MQVEIRSALQRACRALALAGVMVALAWASALRADEPPKQRTNSIGMKLVTIPAGEFLMGGTEKPQELLDWAKEVAPHIDWTLDRFVAETQHRVRITKPFEIGVFEVTKGQFAQFVAATSYKTDAEQDGLGGVGWNESIGKFEQDAKYSWHNAGFEQTDDHPVVNVSWNDAVAFCEWLSKQEGKTYRLPTEAQWEYACRAGTTTRFYHGNDPEGLAGVGNVFDGTAEQKFPWSRGTITARDGYAFTAPVGQFRPNNFGLYDMTGNVSEWCSDWYGEDYYAQSPAADPPGPSAGSSRVVRDGGFSYTPVGARCANRFHGGTASRVYDHGFRVACTP